MLPIQLFQLLAMASVRCIANSACSNSNVASDNSDIHDTDAENVHEQGSRNMTHSARVPLGEIGNRRKKNGGNANKVNAKAALGLQNTGNFALPLAPVSKAARQDVNAAKKPEVIRSNSVVGGGVSQHTAQPIPQKLKLDQAKVFTNLHRSHQLKAVDPSVVIEGGSQLSNDPNEKTDGAPKGGEGNTEDVVQIVQIENGFSSKRFGVIDIDANDEDKVLAQHIDDIYDYLFALEKKYPIKIGYLEDRFFDSTMRAILIDWLVLVHYDFKFEPETLYIATKTVDRYLQIDRNITIEQLQLVGATAMFIAAKFEEVRTPTVHDFVFATDNTFSYSEVLEMEENMLRKLGYDLAPPPSCFFLRRFSKAVLGCLRLSKSFIQLYVLAKYIMELAQVDYAGAHLFPSEQAAGSLSLAMLILEKKPLAELWNCTMQHYSKTTLQGLSPVITIMCGVLSRALEKSTELEAVTNKYAEARAFRDSMPELHIDQWKERIDKELLLYKQ